jgi:hypothetical protein
MLAAVLSDTLYLYPADRAEDVEAAVFAARDDNAPGSYDRMIERILAAGAREATEEEAEGFPVPEYGDRFGMAYPAR